MKDTQHFDAQISMITYKETQMLKYDKSNHIYQFPICIVIPLTIFGTLIYRATLCTMQVPVVHPLDWSRINLEFGAKHSIHHCHQYLNQITKINIRKLWHIKYFVIESVFTSQNQVDLKETVNNYNKPLLVLVYKQKSMISYTQIVSAKAFCHSKKKQDFFSELFSNRLICQQPPQQLET